MCVCLQVRFVDETDPENFVKAMDDKTRAFFCETCSNPACEVVDLKAVADLAHAAGVPLMVDATFSTPYLTKPISFGADVVIHSLTKWMGGHGTGLGGIVIDAGSFKWGAGMHPLFHEPDTSCTRARRLSPPRTPRAKSTRASDPPPHRPRCR